MKKEKIITIIIMICISASLIFIMNHNNSNTGYSNKAFSKEGFFFDTYIRITLYDCAENSNSSKDFQAILNECMNICENYELIFSPTNEDSELYKLNHSREYLSGGDYTLSTTLEDIIDKTALVTTPFTSKFSIYSGNLCSLWDFNNKTIPSTNDINDALNDLNNNKPTSITLGASAKGYITDKIVEYLKNQGIKEALIDLGGNIYALGDKYNNQSYGIGIKKPFSDSNETIIALKVSDKSVVTSGIYERYFEHNGKIYHHIIDLETGYPADNDILSVTIIADSSFVADCYSTGCVLMGKDYTLKLINEKRHEDVECIIIDKNYNIYLSDGLIEKDDCITIKKD